MISGVNFSKKDSTINLGFFLFLKPVLQCSEKRGNIIEVFLIEVKGRVRNKLL